MTPIISRLFDPADFGVFGSFTSVVGFVAAGVTLQYCQAIMLPKDDKNAANLFAVALISVFGISLICLLVSCFFTDWLSEILKSIESKWLVWFLPVGILNSGINKTFQAWCVRRKAFTKTASAQMIRAGSSNVLQLVTGFLRTGYGGLIVSTVTADGCASMNLVRQVYADKRLFKESLAWSQIWSHAKEYRDFPIYSATQNIMNSLSQGLPVLLLANFYGTAVAGAYAFGNRILHAPMDFVLTALRQVLFQKASETYNHGGMFLPLYLKITSGLFLVALLPSIVIFIWAPEIFSYVFGPEWHTAGVYASWLVIWSITGFSNVPAVLLARILRQQRNLFVFEMAGLISRLIVLFLGGYFLSGVQTVILFSCISSLLNIVLIVWAGGVIARNEKEGAINISAEDNVSTRKGTEREAL